MAAADAAVAEAVPQVRVVVTAEAAVPVPGEGVAAVAAILPVVGTQASQVLPSAKTRETLPQKSREKPTCRQRCPEEVETGEVEEAKVEEAKVMVAKVMVAKVEEAQVKEAKVEGAKVKEAEVEEAKFNLSWVRE